MRNGICKAFSAGKLLFGGCAATGFGTLIYAFENSLSVDAYDVICHPVKLPWSHGGYTDSLDISSVRRGWEVYKQVCAACHSMRYLHYRHFVNAFMTEAEAKAEAASVMVPDVDDTGAPFERPGRLTDNLRSPYTNKKAAAAANSGVIPPDLSLMAWARHGQEDYLFALLTSYMDPPAGIKADDGKAYNPYFPGGIIAMPQQLYDEGIEYKDGTVATQSQQAKDVATFMRWAAEPFHDTRKRIGLMLVASLPLITFVILYGKRYVWTILKSQKVMFRTVKGRERPGNK